MIPNSLHSIPNLEAVSKIIITIAKDEILSRFKHLQKNEISEKGMGEIVTAADIQSEIRLAKELTSLIPESKVIGEEEYDQNKSIIERFDGDEPVWVLDPLDGTRNFSQGKPCFCIIVAYCLKNTTYLGWIYDPIKNNMFFAAKGYGAWCNNKKIETEITPKLSEMVGSIGKHRREHLSTYYSKTNTESPKRLTRYRCLGMEYVDLARGKLHFAEYNLLKPWDHAAGVLIMEEAGGYGAFVSSKRPYTPGPIINKRFVATYRDDIWNNICNYLLV
jgi:fructose-1,6-bisphosphatase/inositol monophosphatase family enzyme